MTANTTMLNDLKVCAGTQARILWLILGQCLPSLFYSRCILLRRQFKCNQVFLQFNHREKLTRVFYGVFLSIKTETEVLSKASTLSHIVGPWLLIIVQIRFSAFLTGYQCRLLFPRQLSLSKCYFFPCLQNFDSCFSRKFLEHEVFFLSHKLSRFQESSLLHMQ